MATAHFVSRAMKNIYERGKQVSHIGKGKKNKGQLIYTTDVTTPADNKDKIIIKKGEPYYYWQFKGSDKQYSLGRPKPSQLTRSGYLSTLYDIQDRIEGLSECADASDLESAVEEIKSDLESLKDECESSLDAMPEALQETSSSGQLLQERIDAIDNAISEFDGIDFDYEEPEEDDLREELKDDIDLADLDEPDEDDPAHEDWDEDEERKKLVTDEMIQEKKDEHFSEWRDEKVQEISDISLEG